MLPASLKTKEFTVPAVQSSVKLTNSDTFTKAQKEERKWLDMVMEILKKQSLQNTDWISWSAYHVSIQEATILPAAINALLSLFLESALCSQALYDFCSSSYTAPQPWPSPHYCCRSAIVCYYQADPVELVSRFGEYHFVVMFVWRWPF